jgi:hypothetical protein
MRSPEEIADRVARADAALWREEGARSGKSAFNYDNYFDLQQGAPGKKE